MKILSMPRGGYPLLVSLLLAGCTGKNDTGDQPTDLNNAPVAAAGTDQVVQSDDQILLDGSASYDPDGDAITFHWSLETVPAGSSLMETVNFPGNHTATEETELRPDVAGTYIVSLVVEDAGGLRSASDEVVIKVEAGEQPVANAGADINGLVGSTIALDGTQSYDPLGRTLTYEWTLATAPASSSLTSVDNADQAMASLTPDVGGRYVVSLVVNNGFTDSKPDVMHIDVMSKDPEAPVADAGDDIGSAMDCTAVALDGSDSYDPNKDPLTYEWRLQSAPEGSSASNASFADRNAVTTTFYPDIAGEYEVSLAVYDGTDWSIPDQALINAAERSYNTPPSVDAGADINVDGGTASCEEDGYTYNCETCSGVRVTLGSDAAAFDADGDPLSYSWTVVSGGDANISAGTGMTATALIESSAPTSPLACTDTEYVFELTVTDCPGATGKDRVKVIVTCCGVEDTGK